MKTRKYYFCRQGRVVSPNCDIESGIVHLPNNIVLPISLFGRMFKTKKSALKSEINNLLSKQVRINKEIRRKELELKRNFELLCRYRQLLEKENQK